MICLTGAMALFAFCSVVVGYFQWSVMNGQLGEMKSASADTKQLVTAAKQQAADTAALVLQTREQVNRTNELAERMKEQADQTKIIASEAKIQAAATLRTAEAASKSADTGQRQLDLSERPWLTVTATMRENPTFNPLGLLTMVNLSITNVGHTPAALVLSDARLILDDFRYDDDDYFAFEKTSDALREAMCHDLFLNFTPTKSGATLFPGGKASDNVAIGLNDKQVKHESDSGHTVVLPVLITCTAYHSTFSDEKYWVSNMYELGEIISGEFNGITLQKELKPEQMVLRPTGLPVITK